MTSTPTTSQIDDWMEDISSKDKETTTKSLTSSKMIMKKTSALAARNLDSFKVFQDKKFVSGYQNKEQNSP